uniref:Uncharacterized protein n=1 Tax=Panagrolaimus sp. PS1159 TaxID=55785 RepID=A0AC35FIH4_9BILA
MATKDFSLPLKSKQNNSDGQYKNFSLKQKNFSNAFFESSKNVSSENRNVLNYDFANKNYSKTQKQSYPRNKATKILSPTFGSIDGFKKESCEKISSSSSTSNSTLSLHIEAYESSIVSGLFDGTKKPLKQNGLIRGNAKQLFTDFESVIQNPFEFPRQQQENVGAKTPEVAQYTASQRLLSPNQVNQYSKRGH